MIDIILGNFRDLQRPLGDCSYIEALEQILYVINYPKQKEEEDDFNKQIVDIIFSKIEKDFEE